MPPKGWKKEDKQEEEVKQEGIENQVVAEHPIVTE